MILLLEKNSLKRPLWRSFMPFCQAVKACVKNTFICGGSFLKRERVENSARLSVVYEGSQPLNRLLINLQHQTKNQMVCVRKYDLLILSQSYKMRSSDSALFLIKSKVLIEVIFAFFFRHPTFLLINLWFVRSCVPTDQLYLSIGRQCTDSLKRVVGLSLKSSELSAYGFLPVSLVSA